MLWVVPAHPIAAGGREAPEQTPFPHQQEAPRGKQSRGIEPSCPGRGWAGSQGLPGLWHLSGELCCVQRHPQRHPSAAEQRERLQLSPRSFTLTNSMAPKAVISFSCWPDRAVLVLPG